MANSGISNDYVEVAGYHSFFTTLEDELLELEQFFAEPAFSDGVLSSDTFSLHKCLNATSGCDAPASNSPEGEKAKNEIFPMSLQFAGRSENNRLAVAIDYSDICEDYLLDIDNDETHTPDMETNTNHHSCRDKDTADTCSTGESNALTRIFRFRTKPRARNMKRGRPMSYEYLKSFSSQRNRLLFGLSDMGEESIVNSRKKRPRKPQQRYVEEESSGKNRHGVGGYDAARKDKSGRRKQHTSWTVPEVLRLVEGVSQHGVGKWMVIKSLYFPTCAHRSSVDLKDKWRNLVRASCHPAPLKRRGESVRSSALPTIPHHILCRVRELSAIHPYPRQRMVQGRAT